MKKLLLLITVALIATVGQAQDSVRNTAQVNAAERLFQKDAKLTIGGYAQIDYNQPVETGKKTNGNLDVHRLVLLFGYKFNSKIQLITEIEVEHVKEVYVEQAFLNYKVKDWLNIRGGLLLIPMGIINEYHEPPTFNGVERPNVDYYIVPTTWREIGLGINGNIREISIKYQAYLVNGFISYDGEGKLSGQYGFRKGRQKGAKSIFSHPNLAAKIDYYGVNRLNIGLSCYFGKSQSSLYKNIDRSATTEMAAADSSIVGTSMLGLDLRYNIIGIYLRGQFNYGSFSNTKEYNEFTNNDFGSSMTGLYLEIAYDVFKECSSIKSQLLPFVRYENYNTHNSVAEGIDVNDAYHREEFVFGLGWKPLSGVAIKADYQIIRTKSDNNWYQQFNAGIGLWF
jgi:hypothetical protein